jgi:hypothetical protein
MSTVQRVYRELRTYLNRDEARYAAPRLIQYNSKWVKS